MSVIETLKSDGVERARQQGEAIASSAKQISHSDGFVYLAAFDGTNNDKNDVKLSGNPQDTNVAQLFDQVDKASKGTENLRAGYYPGPGSDGSRTASTWFGPEVTAQVVDTARHAYEQFCSKASEWLETHPGGSVTAMMTSFSRGGASAAIFSQLLWEHGLVDPNSGKTLIPPGEIGVTAGVIYDPVDTGVSGNLAFAPNVRNITVVRSLDERRSEFRGADYTGQPGVTVLPFSGNHCDVGGGYDNGLGALSLEAGTAFFRNSGLSIADVAESRKFNPTQPVVIHTEGVDDYGHTQWTEDAKFGFGVPRLNERVVTAAMLREKSADGETTHFTDFNGTQVTLIARPDGGYAEHMTTRDGHTIDASGDNRAPQQPDSSPTVGGFDIYGMDRKGNIHPSLIDGVKGANEAYVKQWCDERGYREPQARSLKNTG
ncbi:hypothetical protein C0Z18_31185 [Trinickia dabaoshanensis]|uniref:T6SS Phospholipase effector Tle1-like catalytic domain-containing protein n=1 Tax=Trinickia dabaoshanensis TaxID=564714 RepID=A0A2N7VBP5_9BURK|nr:DUF2235 domain-containing protein [Trinickia dabaoshanensis]PMS14504.1 hypothetical protein C0Z18_31185 [Trinickia dabaoshanensis]